VPLIRSWQVRSERIGARLRWDVFCILPSGGGRIGHSGADVAVIAREAGSNKPAQGMFAVHGGK